MKKSKTNGLQNIVIKDSQTLLSWAKKNNIEPDLYVINIMSEVINELNYLVSDNFKPSIDIYNFMLEYQTLVNHFELVKNKKIQLLCSIHFENLIYKYIDYAIKEELYETAENFKKFLNCREQYLKTKLKLK